MTDTLLSRLLIVDDEEDMLGLLERSASSELDCEVRTANNAFKAQNLMDSERFDLVLLDIRMPGMDGMQFLEKIQADHPDTTVVMMTAYGTIDLAVQAIKKGAYDFLTKPFELDKAIHVVAKALERSHLISENRNLQRKIRAQGRFQELVGSSVEMRKIFDTIQLVADSDATVLITGESGTGKDLAARAIHKSSPRAGQRFVAVNCPNLPEEILESELFGYRKGAFTHATRDKKGLFWEANQGTIYLDEIGDISGTLQTKLLRVLQDKEIRPLGETKSFKIDVRIIGSTNQDLHEKISQKLFREDLYYRLNVISLHMPPLRERTEDILPLAHHFLNECAKDMGKDVKPLSRNLGDRLLRYPWPGNVRELENLIRRSALLSSGPEIRCKDFGWDDEESADCIVNGQVKGLPYKDAKRIVLERFHAEYLADALSRNQGNVTQTAKACGLERQALQQVMRRYGLKSKDFQTPNRKDS